MQFLRILHFRWLRNYIWPIRFDNKLLLQLAVCHYLAWTRLSNLHQKICGLHTSPETLPHSATLLLNSTKASTSLCAGSPTSLKSSRNSSATKTKRNFQMLWCIFEGCINRARPSQLSLKNCQKLHFLIQIFFGPNYFFWSAFESAIKWLYPKNVSGSVQVLKQWIKVDWIFSKMHHSI